MKNFLKTDDHFDNPFFIATVEDNYDPTFNYRIKVRIADIHPASILTENLPWAAKLDNSFMGISDTSDVLHSIPEIGSKVLVLAIGNNLNSLVYLGTIYKNTSITPKNNEYINNYGIYRKDGQFIGIDKIQNVLKMIWKGDLDINTQGSLNIKADNVNIEANLTKIKKGQVEITEATTACFNCIPQCLFTGAKHISNKTI